MGRFVLVTNIDGKQIAFNSDEVAQIVEKQDGANTAILWKDKTLTPIRELPAAIMKSLN